MKEKLLGVTASHPCKSTSQAILSVVASPHTFWCCSMHGHPHHTACRAAAGLVGRGSQQDADYVLPQVHIILCNELPQDLWGEAASEMLTVQYRMNSSIMDWSSQARMHVHMHVFGLPLPAALMCCAVFGTGKHALMCVAVHAPAAAAAFTRPNLSNHPTIAGAVRGPPVRPRLCGAAHHGGGAWGGRWCCRAARAAPD